MSLPVVQVDAFSSTPYGGNPAAVCVLDEELPDALMQAIAREMNLSETAFAVRRGEVFGLRWFTPTTEVDLCGHATLATAHVLYDDGTLDGDQAAHFDTRTGRLAASREPDGRIALDFPSYPPQRRESPDGLLEALGIGDPLKVAGVTHFSMVEVADAGIVRSLTPDLTALREVDTDAVIVTAAGEPGSGHDMVSRVFAPSLGIDEDPVTGSAHCALGPWWGERLDKNELSAYQASARGGELTVRLRGDRVDLVGAAVTVLRGELVNHPNNQPTLRSS